MLLFDARTGKTFFVDQAIKLVPAALLSFVLTGCNTTSVMEMPAFEQSEPVLVEAPIHHQATFALSKVIANIRRGTTIAHFPARGNKVEGTFCNYRHRGESTIEWGSGTSFLGDWSSELGEIFFETLSNKGYNISGDPKDLFGQHESVASAEYLIGGRITEITGNICQVHDWWTGLPINEFSGEMSMSVEWTVFSTLTQQEELIVEKLGYHKQNTPIKSGITTMFNQAFASSAENFANDQRFLKLAERTFESEARNSATGEKIFFSPNPVQLQAVDTSLESILPAVVTVRIGSGHGSGFVISSDGLIVTNAHVVGDASQVTVVLNNGLEVLGKVVKANKQRDVALIKVPLRVPDALPVRFEIPRPLEKVYAIGSPLFPHLQSTVTTGIVSALRQDGASGLDYIQSDAAVSPGSSGGPLIDENGNVVGVSVAKYAASGAEGLNLFIPIKSALQSLNVEPRS